MTEWWWKILDIEPTESERDIKRAYAARLKTTRPDDDPDGFQELHGAYKTALMVARNAVHAREYQQQPSEPVETININLNDGQSMQFEQSYDPIPDFKPEEPEVRLSEEQLAKIEELMDELDNLLKFPASAHHLSRWRFLTEPAELLDDEFRIELGRRVMATIVVYNKTPQPKARAWAPVTANIITMLDDTFFWSSAPFLYTDPPTIQEVIDVISIVDPGLRRVTAEPVGGRILEKQRKNKLKDPGRHTTPPPSSGISGWHIWVGLWVGVWLIRACANLTS